MDTKKWGVRFWLSIHFISYPYPNKQCDPKYYDIFFESLGNVLPCIYCRNSYKGFCHELPYKHFLLDCDNDSKEIFYWTYLIHNKVNDKLRDQGNNVDPNPPFKKVLNKYKKINPNIWHSWLTEMIYFICFNYANRDYTDHHIREWYQKFFWALSKVLPSTKLNIMLQKRMEMYPIHNYLKNGEDLMYWAYLITNNKKPFKTIKDYYSQFKATKCGRNVHKVKYDCDKKYLNKEYTLVFNLFG